MIDAAVLAELAEEALAEALDTEVGPKWDLRCEDWWTRLTTGKPLVPTLPLWTEEGERAVAALKMLRVADLPGTPTMAEAGDDWFFDIVRALFGSVDPETRHRAIRELFLLIPKKNSKTSYGALLMLVALLLNTRPRAEFFFIAPVQDTADMAFSQATGAIDLDEVLQAKLHVKGHLKEIEHRVTKAALKIITYDPKTTTGLKVSGGVMIDELHVIGKSPRAAASLRQILGGMLPFPEAFCMYTTTQSDEQPEGVFAEKLSIARDIRDGKAEGRMLPVLYEFPMSIQAPEEAVESEPWMNPKIWKAVNPNMGRSITLAGLVELAVEAQKRGEAEFRAWASQHLNIQIGVALLAKPWRGGLFWDKPATKVVALKGPAGLAYLLEQSEVVTAGVDGGGLDDLYGLCLIGRQKDTGVWLVWTHAWVQRDVPNELRQSERAKFEGFEKDGDLTILDMPGMDAEECADLIMQVEASGLLDRIGVDPAGIGATLDALRVRKLKDLETRVVGIPQGWKLTGAIQTAERKLKAGEMKHGHTRLMAYSVGNAKAEPKGNAIVITKQASGRAKIDPLLALFNAVALMTMNPKGRSKKQQMFFVGGS